MAGFAERYEISCSHCGVLYHMPKLAQALGIAKGYLSQHVFCGELMVYDRMAQVGRPEIYEPDGEVRSRRAR